MPHQGLEKTLPGAPPGDVPVHLRKKQIYATLPQDDPEERWHQRVTQRHMDWWDAKNKAREDAKAEKAAQAGGGQQAEST